MKKNKKLSVLFSALFIVGASCFALNIALGDELPIAYSINVTPNEISLNSANQSENNKSHKEQVINANIGCSEEIGIYDINVYIKQDGEEYYANKVTWLRRNFDTYGNYYLDTMFDKSEVINCANENFVDGEAEIVLRGKLTKKDGSGIITFE
ncbi:hypothetical protein K8R62_03680, partial [bacterium]|nr:hypothetical protein [bacterium]